MQSTLEREFKILVPKEEHRKTIAKVFDEGTIHTLHGLADNKYFEQLEFIVSTGKEAHVFRARGSANQYRAVKVYKTRTSDFKHMMDYIRGDNRFKTLKHERYSIVKTWTRKEFKNLELANQAKVKAPLPLTFKNNVLVMEFIGEKGIAAPTLKEKPAQEPENAFETVLKAMADLLYKSKLIHADLSEYNILNQNEEMILIDMGQSVLTSHPRAKDFFERDIKNITHYFQRQGVQTSMEEAKKTIKQFK
ncbi:serine protein kinase RIO [Candidatus Micrarchaeota archaeon]|nr:serine protein kinase RIO [Candidatus Micrarchaeota archaeon]MBU1930501.1 serine protein kinase RIO [Candidatus Micrarchaeota archaeon]